MNILSLLFGSSHDSSMVSIPTRVNKCKAQPAGYTNPDLEAKRLKSIAQLGDRWVLASTHQNVIAEAKAQGLV